MEINKMEINKIEELLTEFATTFEYEGEQFLESQIKPIVKTFLDREDIVIKYTRCCGKLINKDEITIEEIEGDCRNIPN